MAVPALRGVQRAHWLFHGGVLAARIDTTAAGAVMAGHDFREGSRLSTVSLAIQYMAVALGEECERADLDAGNAP